MNRSLCFIWGISLSFCLLTFNSTAQDSEETVAFDVFKIHPPLSFSMEELSKVESILDLNPYFKSNWVRNYEEIEVHTIKNGEPIVSRSSAIALTSEQKEEILSADLVTSTIVKIKYLPENNLQNNTSKDFDFSYVIAPAKRASYPGGKEELRDFLIAEAINNDEFNNLGEQDIAAIKFKVDREGNIIDTEIFSSSNNEEVDRLLLNAICKMPKWSPASYDSGQNVEEEYALMVGNLKSCVMNMLHIRPNVF